MEFHNIRELRAQKPVQRIQSVQATYLPTYWTLAGPLNTVIILIWQNFDSANSPFKCFFFVAFCDIFYLFI